MTRHHRHARRRRAFATIFALFLLALVGAALLALTSLMTTDARRSTRGAADAQLRQLLHAGAVAAVEQVRSAGHLPDAGFHLAPPREFASAAAAGVRVSRGAIATTDRIRVLIDARLGDHASRLQMLLIRNGDAWHVHSVEP